MQKPSRRRRTAAEIQQILGELADSGLSRRQFAAQRGHSLPTLHAWIARHHRASVVGTPDLIPVGTFNAPKASIEIEFPGGEILRLVPGWCAEDLRIVLTELRRC